MSTEGGAVDGPESRVDLAERLRGVRASVARIGGLALAVIIIAAIFSIRTDGQMLDTDNLLGIARAVSTVAILSLGLLVVIIAGEIDLSFANLYGLCTNVMAVVWLTHEWPVYVAIVIAFAVAIFWGCFNAFFTAVVGIPSFIATLGSSTLIFGATLYIGETKLYSPEFPEDGTPPPASELDFFQGLSTRTCPANIPMQAVWTTVLLVVFGFLLGRSLFGFRLKAIGGNRDAATPGAPARAQATSSRRSSSAPAWPASAACSTSRSSAPRGRTPARRTCSRSSPRSSSAAPASPAAAAPSIGTLFGALLLAVLAQRPRAGGRRAVRAADRCSAP